MPNGRGFRLFPYRQTGSGGGENSQIEPGQARKLGQALSRSHVHKVVTLSYD